MGLGFRASLGFGVVSLGFRVWGCGLRVKDLGVVLLVRKIRGLCK